MMKRGAWSSCRWLLCGLGLAVMGNQAVWSAEETADAKDKPAAEQKETEPKGDKPEAKSRKKELSREELEAQFEKDMSGVLMIGRFTVVGREDKPPAEEKYTITKVKKVRDDYWLFETRIQYGKNDVKVPLVLKVIWSGDTPVITLTDFTIPGMGTFTARVLIYRGWYSGTWEHGPVGGHLFGRIEKLPEDGAEEDKAASKEKAAEAAPTEKQK